MSALPFEPVRCVAVTSETDARVAAIRADVAARTARYPHPAYDDETLRDGTNVTWGDLRALLAHCDALTARLAAAEAQRDFYEQQIKAGVVSYRPTEGETRAAYGRIHALAERLATALAWQDGVREREAACCPEDVPFDEYIAALQNRPAAAEAQYYALYAEHSKAGGRLAAVGMRGGWDRPRCYPNDHGQYHHVACGICRAPFYGGKGRVVCRVCLPAGEELRRLRMTYEPEQMAEMLAAAMKETP